MSGTSSDHTLLSGPLGVSRGRTAESPLADPTGGDAAGGVRRHSGGLLFARSRAAERPPVMMLKFEILRWLSNLSDPGVIERATTDLALRYFLQIRISGPLPHPTSLCRFRAWLGGERFRQVFSRVVQIARQHGGVKDHLRLNDATISEASGETIGCVGCHESRRTALWALV
ncbi:MAG: transposase [Planctomycetota bacterium]